MDQHQGMQPEPVKKPDSDHNTHVSADPPAGSMGPRIPDDLAGSSEGAATFGQWLAQNGVTLAIVVALGGFLLTYFDPLTLFTVALGLSFVIFIHELGHFLVAKWCDVHVTTFSIGFGPAIPGCSFQWGETTYKLALFPLGGYVQMVGQVDGDESSDGSEDDPRSYRNKTVGQRMWIISAGVIMNVILAFVCFIVVFQGPGKERKAAIVSYTDTDSPAYKVGLSTGSVIKRIGNIDDPYFEDLKILVMLSGTDEQLELVAMKEGDEKLEVSIEPRKGDLAPYIGIIPSDRPQLATRRRVAPSMTMPAWPGSPAAKATPAFEFADRIVATTDPADPNGKPKELPPDPRNPKQRDYFEFARRMQDLAGKPIVLVVERDTKDSNSLATVPITVPPAFHPSLGIRMHMGYITAIRKNSPAAKASIQVRDTANNRDGDLIQEVSFSRADGKKVKYTNSKPDPKDPPLELRPLDPLKLPFQLREDMAKQDAQNKKVTLHVRRTPDASGPVSPDKEVVVDWNDAWKYDRAIPMTPTSPWAIPELGLAYMVKTSIAGVDDSGPKDNPLEKWDEIKEIRITQTDDDGEEKTGSWVKLESDGWANAFASLARVAADIARVDLKVKRQEKPIEVSLVPVDDATWPMAERGLILMDDVRIQKADNFIDAIALGFKETRNSMLQVFLTIRGMITNRLSVKNLGGPLMIANVAYRIAGYGFAEFVFFLGLISVNLAVINFLPIPVLDGGHMVFLAYEKLRGKPASEGVRTGAIYAGLALILCLMIFVLYLDIPRLLL